MRIGIIGGGPAGMFAAIEANKTFPDIWLFDNNANLGRKLAVTGAGRGNLTNLNIDPSAYSSLDKFPYREIISIYDFQFLSEYFRNLGIYTYHTDDGWVYPISNSAKNIAKMLEEHIYQLGIKIKRNTEIKSIRCVDNKFVITDNDGAKEKFDKLIVATGGKEYPQLNANNKILDSIKALGHRIIPSYPALAPINTTKNETKQLLGVRQDSTIRIFSKNKLLSSEFGNIIFTDLGINGPGAMNLSHLVHNKGKDFKIEIDYKDLLPQDFFRNTIKIQGKFKSLSAPLLPILNQKIIVAIFSKLNLDPAANFSKQDFSRLIDNLYFTEKILGTRSFEFAQGSTGGVCSSKVNPDTLESSICPGLYFAGEVLDVIGPCGGYNLHWAFVSGIVAGKLL